MRSRPFNVTRYCVGDEVEEKGVSAAEWNSVSSPPGTWGGTSIDDSGNVSKFSVCPFRGGAIQERQVRHCQTIFRMYRRSDRRLLPRRCLRGPDSPTSPVQLLSPLLLSAQLPPPASSFGENCAPSQAPLVGRGRHDNLSYYQLHELRKRRGCSHKGSKDSLEAR